MESGSFNGVRYNLKLQPGEPVSLILVNDFLSFTHTFLIRPPISY